MSESDRHYSSSLGRFLSPDWSAIPAPVPYANLTNPHTLNLYQYTEDNLPDTDLRAIARELEQRVRALEWPRQLPRQRFQSSQ